MPRNAGGRAAGIAVHELCGGMGTTKEELVHVTRRLVVAQLVNANECQKTTLNLNRSGIPFTTKPPRLFITSVESAGRLCWSSLQPLLGQHFRTSLPVGTPHKVRTLQASCGYTMRNYCLRLVPEGIACSIQTLAQVVYLGVCR